MTYDIHGWVEVCRFSDSVDDHGWSGVINLSGLIDVSDAFSESFFGLSKRFPASKPLTPAVVAGRRGLPHNPSEAVAKDVAEIMAYEGQYGAGEFGGYTHATWAELKAHQISESIFNESEWPRLFQLISGLEAYAPPERIRIVVWYCW